MVLAVLNSLSGRVEETVQVFRCERCSKLVVPEESLYEKIYMGNTLCVSCRKDLGQPLTSDEKAAFFAEEDLVENRAKYQQVSSWYVWKNVKEMWVMDSHKLMDGVLVNWNEPPCPELLSGREEPFAYYHAGEIAGCRCYPEPLTRPGAIQWPRRVYINGNIAIMTHEQFEKIFNK
ncbi:hypothetical protein [Propionispora sp. 2/2-37]|uniref:hypothetical protein n=1 Tax=Propionispora sp. 2/2-37 TaxID=1677858 RepID=UPI001C1068F2|nr:hypothetical protein [Propionispora sp. 2/2-37]